MGFSWGHKAYIRRAGRRVLSVLTGTLVLAATLSGSAAALPPTDPDMSERNDPPNPFFSYASAHTSRPLLVIFVQFSDVHTADDLTEADIAQRFFGAEYGEARLPTARTYLHEASGGAFELQQAKESGGIRDNGVVVVDGGTRPVAPEEVDGGEWQRALIHDGVRRADPVVDFSRFDVLDGQGRPTPDANGDGRPDGDGQLNDFELLVNVMREAKPDLTGDRPDGDNGGVAHYGGIGGMEQLDGKGVAPLSAVLTTSLTVMLGHLHELFHIAFRGSHEHGYRGDPWEIMGYSPNRESFWLPSGYTRYRFGWTKPTVVTGDGWVDLSTGPHMVVENRAAGEYTLIEQRVPTRRTADWSTWWGVVAWLGGARAAIYPNPLEYPEDEVPPFVFTESGKNTLFRPASDIPNRHIDVQRADDGSMRAFIDTAGPGASVHAGFDGWLAPFIRGTSRIPVTVTATSPQRQTYVVQAKATIGALSGQTTVTLDPGQTRVVDVPVTGRYDWGAALLVSATAAGHTSAGRTIRGLLYPSDTDTRLGAEGVLARTAKTVFDRRILDAASTLTTARGVWSGAPRRGALSDATDADYFRFDVPTVDSRMDAVANCGTISAGSEDVVVTSWVQGRLKPASIVPTNEWWSVDRSTLAVKRDGLSTQIVDCPTGDGGRGINLDVGRTPTNRGVGLVYEISADYNVAAERIPAEADFLDSFVHGPARSVFTMPCPGGSFPACPGPGVRSVFTAAHPFDPSRGSSCQAGGCPDFAVFRWSGGPFEVNMGSAKPIALSLRNHTGKSVASFDPPAVPPGDTIAPQSAIGSSPVGPLGEYNAELKMPYLAPGFYALEITGEATDLTVAVPTAGTDTDLDGVLDDVDVCPFAADPGQSDVDTDGTGDACDARQATITSIQFSDPAPYWTDTVTATASIAGLGAPGGAVQFAVGGVDAGEPVPLGEDGKATVTLPRLDPGSHQVTARYSGTPVRLPSQASVTHQVFAVPTQVEAKSYLIDVYRNGTFQSDLQLHAVLWEHRKAGRSGLPGQVVTFRTYDGAFLCQALTDTAGNARCNTIPSLALALRTVQYVASYDGSQHYDSSFAVGGPVKVH